MRITYEWRELTSDGLLKTPDPVGPHYCQTQLYGGDTEEEAIDNFAEFVKDECVYGDYVLVKVFSK